MTSTNIQINPNIFREYDLRGIAGVDLSAGIACLIGKAIGTYILSKNKGNDIIVGMDNRLSSEELKKGLIDGIISTGCNVIDIGLATTPLMYYAVAEGNYSGGVNVTASHNPREYNGFKIVEKAAYPVAGKDISEIRDLVISRQFSKGKGEVTFQDPAPSYFAKIKSLVHLERPLKVVVDCGNAIPGKFAPSLLSSLGCEVVELYCDLDGRYPNHLPNPEHEANVQDAMNKVKEVNADIGIAIDGDGDRIGIIDEKGKYLSSDYTAMLLAREYLERHPGSRVLIDVKLSSLNVVNDIKNHGGIPVVYKVGHSLIKRYMRAEGINLGAELSGHMYVFENYYPFDDAFVASAKVLEILSRSDKTLSEHFTDLPKLYTTPMIEVYCDDSVKFDVIAKLVALFSSKYEVNTIDGARVSFPDGWALIRASNTTPTLTFRAEADSSEGLKRILQEMYAALKLFPIKDPEAILTNH